MMQLGQRLSISSNEMLTYGSAVCWVLIQKAAFLLVVKSGAGGRRELHE